MHLNIKTGKIKLMGEGNNTTPLVDSKGDGVQTVSRQDAANVFEDTYAKINEKSAFFIQNADDVTISEKRELHFTAFAALQYYFNQQSGFKMTYPAPKGMETENVEIQIARSQIAKSNAPEHLDTWEEVRALQDTPKIKRDNLSQFIAANPNLTFENADGKPVSFTIEDAIKLARNDDCEMQEVVDKFPNATRDVLMGTAYMMLHLNPEALAENHTEFRIGTMLTDFSSTAHSDVFQTAQDHEAYKKWEAGKRVQIINKITSNPQIMSDLAKIKAPKSLSTAEDIEEQQLIKERIADAIGGVFAEVYDLKTLDSDDIHVVFQDFNMMEEGGRAKAFVWNIAPGIENDETVIFRESPAHAMMTKNRYTETNMDTTHVFLHSVIEEMQHTTDHIHADQLINGTMSTDHPAHHHASLLILNTLSIESTPGLYENQVSERTAKEVAENITSIVGKKVEATNVAGTTNEEEPENQKAIHMRMVISPSTI